MTIELTLFGPYHDRYFDLKYTGATAYEIGRMPGSGEIEWIDFRGTEKRKDDLLVHEFDVLPDGLIEHRYLFVSGMTIFVQCAGVAFTERLIEGGGEGLN